MRTGAVPPLPGWSPSMAGDDSIAMVRTQRQVRLRSRTQVGHRWESGRRSPFEAASPSQKGARSQKGTTHFGPDRLYQLLSSRLGLEEPPRSTARGPGTRRRHRCRGLGQEAEASDVGQRHQIAARRDRTELEDMGPELTACSQSSPEPKRPEPKRYHPLRDGGEMSAPTVFISYSHRD